MNLRDKLVDYTKVADQPAIVDNLIQSAKEGKSGIIIDRYKLSEYDIQFLIDEGLDIGYYEYESIVKIHWGHWKLEHTRRR